MIFGVLLSPFLSEAKTLETTSRFDRVDALDLDASALPGKDQPEFDGNIPESLRRQVLEDLEFLASRKGEKGSETFYEIFDQTIFDGSRLLEFFNRRVRKVAVDSDPRDPSLIAYIKINGDPSVIWLKASYTSFDMPQIFRVSLLLHESRHTEIDDGFWLHPNCPTPFVDSQGRDIVGALSGEKIEGRDACDHSSYGSYGAQATFLKHIDKVCSNCSEKQKLDARLYSEDAVARILDPEMQQMLRDELESAHENK